MFEDRVIIDPEIRHVKPIIKGTRVPVDVILGSLAVGMEVQEIADEYGIDKKDMQAAIEYATKIVAKEEISAYA
jgi:uncharacterized protein (DUF433 family)